MRALLLLLLASSPAAAATCDAESCSWTLGMKLLRQEQYDEAIPWLLQGFRLSQDPKFLFELAECHRLSGRDGQAIVIYEHFLRVAPQAANRAETEAQLGAARARLEEQRTRLEPPPRKPPRRRANALIASGGSLVVAGVIVSLSGIFAMFGEWKQPRLGVELMAGGMAGIGAFGGTLLAVGIVDDRRPAIDR